MLNVALGAGIGAISPIIMELLRDKPDPAAAKTVIESKRAEMVDMKIGAGVNRQAAEKQVDQEIQAAVAEAEKQGQFNFPGGEMIAGAILGGLGGVAFGKVAGMIKGKAAGKAVEKAVDGDAAASKVADTALDAAGSAKSLPPGQMPAIGNSAPTSMAAPNPTGMPFPSMTTKADLADEFAGMRPMRGAETASRDALTGPFPARARGPQTLEDEFGISPRTSEMGLRQEFGNDIDLADRIGRMTRLRRPMGD